MLIEQTAPVYDEQYPFLNTAYDEANNSRIKLAQRIRAYSEVFEPLGLQKGDNILDVGSCLGTLGHILQDKGISTYGIDLNIHALLKGRELYGEEPLNNNIIASALNLPFVDNAFSAVTSIDVFEHLLTEEDAELAFCEMERVCAGQRMVHKITVLEDSTWINADETHTLKKSADWWYRFFEYKGWNMIKGPNKLYPDFRKINHPIGRMHGYFLLERS